ncbi:alpha/beta fold hydrolase [Planctomycetota bacterium]|nr:alpha/beta fold hydrolase [Planctomycetota bacterium]
MRVHELEVPTIPTLGATVTVPDAPKAVALMVQGSGVHDRDGSINAIGFKSTLYRRVARELAKRGEIVTLRYDKRGHNRPENYPHEYTIDSRMDDARIALETLRSQPEFAGLPVYLIGHSEGGMMVSKLAESVDVAGVVSLAAPFGNVFELGKDRFQRLIDQGRGATAERGRAALEFYSQLERLFAEGAQLLPTEFVEMALPFRDKGYQGWESFEWLAGHWAEALNSDPTKNGNRMLVVQGGRDARLWADNPRRWEDWTSKRELADYKLIDHMGHDLNDARQKLFKVYEEVLDAVVEWINKNPAV